VTLYYKDEFAAAGCSAGAAALFFWVRPKKCVPVEEDYVATRKTSRSSKNNMRRKRWPAYGKLLVLGWEKDEVVTPRRES